MLTPGVRVQVPPRAPKRNPRKHRVPGAFSCFHGFFEIAYDPVISYGLLLLNCSYNVLTDLVKIMAPILVEIRTFLYLIVIKNAAGAADHSSICRSFSAMLGLNQSPSPPQQCTRSKDQDTTEDCEEPCAGAAGSGELITRIIHDTIVHGHCFRVFINTAVC